MFGLTKLSRSITARAFLATCIAIILSLSIAGYAMYNAFALNALEEVQNRLRSNINMMLSAVIATDSALKMPDILAEPRLSTPASGLYAFIEDGNRDIVWNSHSAMLGQIDQVPPPPPIGQKIFSDTPQIGFIDKEAGLPLYAMGISIMWDYGNGTVESYTFWVMEEKEGYQAKMLAFIQRLILWLGIGAVVLLVAQMLLWWWVHRPIKKLALDIQSVEKGEQLLLDTNHPLEFMPVVDNLNTLLDFQQRRINRSRNTLQDLAHSLKTPLAVLRNTVGAKPTVEELSTVVNNQVTQMNQTVSYQLQKAATAGQSALLAPISLNVTLRKIINTLQKVYADKHLHFDLQLKEDIMLRADSGDMLELFGNVLDNASKWGKSAVVISAHKNDKLIRITIEDDGPGISDANKAEVLERGKRADQAVPGHGVGMAIVKDIIEEGYNGTLYLYDSAFGGAKIVIDLPNNHH